jgi:hypothetical protein
MVAHKIKVDVAVNHELAIRLPEDFPLGPAEVIVLALPALGGVRAAAGRLRPHPALGKIVFREDPTLPLDPDDWPEA